MSADVKKAENNTCCGYNYVQMAIFLSKGLFGGLKRKLSLALFTFDVSQLLPSGRPCLLCGFAT